MGKGTLLVTLTADVGGAVLSIGSAAGIALMGQVRGKYTFFGHLKWALVLALSVAKIVKMGFFTVSVYNSALYLE